LYIVYLSIVNFYDTRAVHLDRRIHTLVYNEITTLIHEGQVIKVAADATFNASEFYIINLYMQNNFVNTPELHDDSIFDNVRIIDIDDNNNRESK
jgi:hypothetical protein